MIYENVMQTVIHRMHEYIGIFVRSPNRSMIFVNEEAKSVVLLELSFIQKADTFNRLENLRIGQNWWNILAACE